MDHESMDIEFGVEPQLVFDEKAIGGKLGPQIGGGLRKPPPGMVFVDITGAIDGDADGIVFEATPFARPIIPRAVIPATRGRERQQGAIDAAIANEERRRNGETVPSVGSASRTGGGDKKKPKQRKLTDEELRIQQEQKLRAQTVPKKRKPGPDAREWDSGSKSTTISQAAIDNPKLAKIVDDYLDIYPPVGSKSSTRGRGGKTYPKKSKDEKLDELTKLLSEALIAALENSEGGKWKRPWKDFGLYRNGKTGKPYKGSNQAILAIIAELKGYSRPEWLTYKQAQELGGQVRKGEKGTMLAFWKRSTFEVAGPDGETEERQRWMSSFFTVFNIDQIDGIDPSRFPEPKVLSEELRIETIQKIVEELGVSWAEGGDRAYNSPTDDRIQMPPFASFDSPEAFYATLMHEIVHWTGNPGRLDRPKMNRFGSPEYAYEELIAEIGSSMLMAVLGLEERPDDQHVAYIASWLKALKDDPSQVSQAAAAAQKAIDWLIANSPTLKALFDDYYPPIGDGTDDEGDGDIGIPDIPETPDTSPDRRWRIREGRLADGSEKVSETPTPQDSSNSWDYDNFGIAGSKSTTKPQYPRKPPAPAFSGRAAELIKGVKTWDEFWERMGDEEIVFIDYETTGLVFDEFNEPSSNGLPTQIGAVRMRNGRVIERFNVYINPGIPHSEWEQWSRDNLKDEDGNLITQEFLDGQPSVAEAHRRFIEWAGEGVILGMQNAVFDNEVLTDALRESGIDWEPDGIIDTKEIADATLPKWSPENEDAPFKIDKATGEKRPSNSLADITKYLGVSLGDKHHTADYDAAATGEVLTRIVEGAIEKGWPTDALDPEKRRQKEEAKRIKFERDIEEFNKNKDEWMASQSGASKSTTRSAPDDGVALEFYTPGSRSTTRRWGSSASRRSVNSQQRKEATHVDISRVSVGDVFPDNWDAPNFPLGEPRWSVRSVIPNIDGTVSVVLGDMRGEQEDIDIIFDKGSLIPNVTRGLPLRATRDKRPGTQVDSVAKFTQNGKLKNWNSPDVTYRRNASLEATEFSLFDDGLPRRVSPFNPNLFNRGDFRSEETQKLSRATNRHTIDSVEDSMQFIANKAQRDLKFQASDAVKLIRELRRDIAHTGIVENLDINVINDLIEGTYTGDGYRRLNDILRRRGKITGRNPYPVSYPAAVVGSKSTTRNDLRPIPPSGVLVDGSSSDGGFWRSDFTQPLMEDTQESEAYDPRIAQRIILTSRIMPLTIDGITDIVSEDNNLHKGIPMSRDKWRFMLAALLSNNRKTIEAYNLGKMGILFFAPNTGQSYLVESGPDGRYPEFATRKTFEETVLRSLSSNTIGTRGISPNLQGLPSRYDSGIRKVQKQYGPHVLGFRMDSTSGHHALWLVDEAGHIVSLKAVGVSLSPGRDDSNYIPTYIGSKIVQERFEKTRGILSARPDYLYDLIPYTAMPPTNASGPVDGWIRVPPLDPRLKDRLTWQISIDLDENRMPAFGSDSAMTLVQIDIYEVPNPDGTTSYRLMGEAIDGRSADLSEIKVDFPTREAAVSYALSEVSPYPYHAWVMNSIARRTRLPEGLDESYLVDKTTKDLLVGDRVFSKLLGASGSKSHTGQRIYYDSYAIAENIVLADDSETSAARFDNFIEQLSIVNERSRSLLKQLEDELAKDNPDDGVVSDLERAMKIHDLVTASVADAIFDLASRHRQWRTRKAAVAVARKLLADEVRDGSSTFSQDEVARMIDALSDNAENLYGEITSAHITGRLAQALSILRELNWPDLFDSKLDREDQLTEEDVLRLIDSPTEEIMRAARTALDAQKYAIRAQRSKTRKSILEDVDTGESVSGYRPLLLGNPLGGSKSRTNNASYVNGRGLGDSRLLHPTPGGQNESQAVDSVYYDGGRQELVVRFSGSDGEYIYGGIPMGVADKLERSFGIGRDINSLIRNGEYSYIIKPNGETEGEPPSLRQLLNSDIERLSSYSEFTGHMIDEIRSIARDLENGGTQLANMDAGYLDNVSLRMWATAANLSQISGEHSAADHLLQLINAIDDFRSSGLAGRASTRNRMPLKDKTILRLNPDELGEIRQEIKEILRENADDSKISLLADFAAKIKEAQDAGSPVTLNRADHEKYIIAYDRLFAKALNKETNSKFRHSIGESILNLAAFSGKYDSPRIDSGGGFRGRPYNMGAPSGFSPENIIGWARNQRSFRVVQNLVQRFDNNGGFLTVSEWRRLAEYHDNSQRRRNGRYNSGPINSSKSTTLPVPSSSDEPTPDDLAKIDGDQAVSGQKKKTKMPEGKSIREIFGDRLDGLSPEEQIDALFEVGIATPKNKNGINQAEFESRIRELDIQHQALEAMQEEQALRDAMADAVRRGEEFDEEAWYEGFAKMREQRRKAVIDKYMEMLLGDNDEERERAERFLGFTKDEWIARKEEAERLRVISDSLKEKEDKRKTKTSYSVPELIKKLRRAAQTRLGALDGSNEGDEQKHTSVWESALSLLDALISEEGILIPEVVLDDIANLLNEYQSSIFDAMDPDRGSGGPSSEARRSIAMAKQWEDVIRNSLDAVESEEDDDEIIDDEGDGIAGSKSTTASPMFEWTRPEYEYGTDAYADKVVKDPRNWRFTDDWGQPVYHYVGPWPDILSFPKSPPPSIIGKIRRRESDGPQAVLFGVNIPVYDDFKGLPDDMKTTVVDGIHIMPPRDEPRLDIDMFIPGSRGEKFIDIPMGGRGNKKIRYTRTRPNWMNTSRQRPDLSSLTDSELKQILAALRTDSERNALIMALEKIQEERDQRRPRMGSGQIGSSRMGVNEQKYKIDDIINELESRGYFVYGNEDPTSNAPRWYVVANGEATNEQLGRRRSGRWTSTVDQTAKPEDRVDPDGERNITPVDVVQEIIESDDVEVNEDKLSDLIDNSDIDEMSDDEVNAELLNIRDELEDLRRRANAKTISREEYNERRRELNRRKALLLKRKHGNKDAQRAKAERKPRQQTKPGSVVVNNTGTTNINVTGDNNTVINTGGTVPSGSNAPQSRRTGRVVISTSGIRELRQIEAERRALRGQSPQITGSKSTTSDGRRKMEFYKLEFGLTGSDFEEIVNGIGSEESLKKKYGLTNEDIDIIRSNWSSALPVGDLARINGHDDIDVRFIEEYDQILEILSERIAKIRQDSEDLIRSRMFDNYAERKRRIDKAKQDFKDLENELRSEDSINRKEIIDEAKSDLDNYISEVNDYFDKELRKEIARIQFVLDADVAELTQSFKRRAGLQFIDQYLQSMNDEDNAASDIAKLIRQFALVGGYDPSRGGSLFDFLEELGIRNGLVNDILDQVRQDAQAMFRSGARLEDIFDNFRLSTDGVIDDSAIDQILRLITDGAIIPDLLGSTHEYLWPKRLTDEDLDYMDSQAVKRGDWEYFDKLIEEAANEENSGDDPESRTRSLDPENINFVSYDEYIAGKNVSNNPRYERMFIERYLHGLTQAYTKLIWSGHPSLTTPIDDESSDFVPTPELRNAYMTAVRKTLVTLSRLNEEELVDARNVVAGLFADDELVPAEGQKDFSRAESILAFFRDFVEMGGGSSNESPLDFMESLLGLDRSQLIDTLRDGFMPPGNREYVSSPDMQAQTQLMTLMENNARNLLATFLHSDMTIEEIARITGLSESGVARLIKERSTYGKSIFLLGKIPIWTDSSSGRIFKSLIESGYSASDIAALFEEDLEIIQKIVDIVTGQDNTEEEEE